MKRLRIFARVAPFWNPCIFAMFVATTNPVIVALREVCRLVKALTYTLTDD